MTRPRTIGSDVGTLVFWGSDCLDCGNSTPASMRCDLCKETSHTVALWMEQPKP